jgi:5-methylcytosine-specific restriction protein A
MNTYLFVWNPLKWDWPGLEENIGQVNKTGRVNKGWTIASHKTARPGDRAFLARVGVEPKGIIGSGYLTTAPARYWNERGREYYRIEIDFEVLLNAETKPILGLDILCTGDLALQNWTPQSSGISIRPELVDELEGVWADFLELQNLI